MTTFAFNGKQPAGETPGQQPASRSYSFTVGLTATAIGAAAVSWLAGLGLNRGFGVHIPFLAGLFVILSLQFLVRSLTLMAAGAWHDVAAQAAARQAQGFLELDRKLRGE